MANKIPPAASLETAFDEIGYTLGRLKAEPLTKHLASDFDGLRPQFWSVLQTELDLSAALQAAFALIGACDDNLNQISDAVIKVLLSLCKRGFQDPLYKLYCGEKRPYEFKEPILGEQLESVRGWIISMRNPAAAPELQSLADAVERVITEADEAISARDKIQKEIADFRTFGARKLFFDTLNQKRETLAQDLDKMREANRLSEGFSEKFFRRQRAKSQTQSRVDNNILRKEIVLLEQQLAEKKSRLLESEQQEEQQRKADQELEATMNALAESQRLAEEAQRKAAEIRAKYPKKK